MFSFPKDPVLRAAWAKAVPRKHSEITRYMKVCEQHFEKRYFVTTSRYEDKKTGRVIEAPLSNIRLTSDAVPTIFPERPVAADTHVVRATASGASGAVHKLYVLCPAPQVSTFIQVDPFTSVRNTKPSSFWTVVSVDTHVMFLNVTYEGCPTIKYSVVVERDLTVRFFVKSVQFYNLGEYCVPSVIKDPVELNVLLDKVEAFDKGGQSFTFQETVSIAVPLALSALRDVRKVAPEEQLDTIDFLVEQLQLLQTQTAMYSRTLLVFACLMYTISPQAYNFVMNSSGLVLPHPSLVKQMCSTCENSQQNELEFLLYIRQRFGRLDKHERIVTLQVDEIKLEDYSECKEGSGHMRAAYVFMLQSLLSGNRDIAYVLQAGGATSHDILHAFLRKFILALEKMGLTVVAVIADSNPAHKEIMSRFAMPSPKVDIVYQHPKDANRPLFFIIDPVHLLKSIRSNWISQQNTGQCLTFPDFDAAISAFDSRPALVASFVAFQKFQLYKNPDLFKVVHCTAERTLNPSRTEQRLAESLFTVATAEEMRSRVPVVNIEHAVGTAVFIEIVARWWSVVNGANEVLTSRDDLRAPVASMDSPQIEFLGEFMDWLDAWGDMQLKSGKLTEETHAALRLTCYSLTELTRYCLEELKVDCIMLGRFQTDRFQDRFGAYQAL